MNLVYLTDIIILLTAAVIAVPLFRFLGLGTVPGFLTAGVVVGPSVLGLIDNMDEIGHLAELGVVLLLFVIGIELKPSRLWLMRRMVFGLGVLQVIVTGAVISATAYFVFDVGPQAAILIGPALALSSTAFVLQLLTEQKMLTSNYGRTSVAVLLLQDLAVVPLLALVTLLTATDLTIEEDIGLALLEALVILTLIILGGRYLLQPVLHRVAHYGSPEIFTASAVLLVLGTAVLMAQIGLSMAMGAFVAGLLVADSEFRHQVMAELQPFRGLFLGLFFMSMGMSFELELLLEKPLLPIGLTVALMTTKVALLWPLASLYGHKNGSGLAIALLLAQSGEFAMVLFAVAFGATLLNQELYQQLLIIVVLSMLATPPIAGLAYRLTTSRRGESLPENITAKEVVSSPVVIIGFGRVGRRVGEILEMRNVPYIAIDNSADIVKRERGVGRSVYFGDAQLPDALKSMGVNDASLVIVSIDDFQVTEQIVSTLRSIFPQLDILARGRDLENCRRLHLRGVRLAVSENLEASIALARAALEKVTQDEDANETAINAFRSSYCSDTEGKAQQRPVQN